MKELEIYLNTIQSLSESTGDYLYLWEITADRMWFFGNISEKYNLISKERPYCTVADWENIVCEKDRAAFKEAFDMIIKRKRNVHNMEYRVIDKEGKSVWLSCRGKVNLGNENSPLVMIGRVSDTALLYKVDDLTGMFNLIKFNEDIGQESWNLENRFLLLLGVDNLKQMNITHGREYSDSALKFLAETLEEMTDFRKAYRLERDCFAIFLSDVTEEEVDKFYKEIQDRVQAYLELSGGAASISNIAEEDMGKLYQYAEYALDRAKQLGKRKLEFFSEEDYQKELVSISLAQELAESIKNGCAGFSLVYQPQIKTGSYWLFGAEVLLRYTSPTRGPVMPNDFIPILEQNELICEVGLWVLREALGQCLKWREKMPEFHISVNLSMVQLMQDDIMESVLNVLQESGLPGTALTLELTESMQLQNLRYYNLILEEWRKAGINIAVDDFGTGYSSLGYLKHLKIDEIKIDRCFVSGIQNNSYNYRLLYTVINLVTGTPIRICCEGVEEKEELQALEELKPDLLQGYLFSKPCDSKQFERMYFERGTEAYQEYRKHIGQVQKKRFRKLMQLKHYDILSEIDLGLWVIHMDINSGEKMMYADDTMIRIMGANMDLSPEECYRFWYGHVREDCLDYVNDAVARCIAGEGAIQVQYVWQHPELGDVDVYCAATCVEKSESMVCLEGYHRVLRNIEMTCFQNK